MSLSRRKFLKSAAIAAGTAAAYGAVAAPVFAKVEAPKKWDAAYDVVVIGYGGAGAVAAITAHDNGAKVLIVEKMSEGGGNTAVSLGGLFNPNDEQKALKYMKKLYEYSESDMDPKLVETFIKNAMSIAEWVKGLKPGTELKIYGHAGFPHVDGSESVDKWSVSVGGAGGGGNLWQVYSYAVEEARKIPVMLNTPAKRLVTDDKGAVIGVIVSKAGKDYSIKASKAVILTCGGYEYDEKMLKNSIKGYPVYGLGNPGNTGDGVRMSQEVGAQIWHMNGVSGPIGMKLKGFKAATPFLFAAPGYILVDRTGKRFVNEKSIETHSGLSAVDVYDGHALRYQRIPCYAIFDHKALSEGGALNGGMIPGYAGYKENLKWSRKNEEEVGKGYILKADTVAALASQIKVDPAVLTQTVDTWNKDMSVGKDTLFGRTVENTVDESKAAYKDAYAKVLSAPITKAPFYAVEIVPTMFNTQGGPKRNEKAQVLNPFDEPIKGLYCAGELGSIWGLVYQGAGNNAESVVFGRIAGKNAASEKSR